MPSSGVVTIAPGSEDRRVPLLVSPAGSFLP